jgi:TRAP-type C4-dicarboxylate transport system permease small subunit
MLPPTPTPLPPGTAMITIPEAYTLWGSTDWAVQSWNLLGDGRIAIQAIFLVGLVIIGMFILQRFARDFTQKDSQN